MTKRRNLPVLGSSSTAASSTDTRIALVTLGCDKNTVDSERYLAQLADRGAEYTDDLAQAEVIVINTCGFIDAAKKESLDAIVQAGELKASGVCQAVVADLVAVRVDRVVVDRRILDGRNRAGLVHQNILEPHVSVVEDRLLHPTLGCVQNALNVFELGLAQHPVPPQDFVFAALKLALDANDTWARPAIVLYRRAAALTPALCRTITGYQVPKEKVGCR